MFLFKIIASRGSLCPIPAPTTAPKRSRTTLLEHPPYPVFFGTLTISGKVIPLSGKISCSIPYLPKIDPPQILTVSHEVINWGQDMGLFSPEKADYLHQNPNLTFTAFAALTTLSLPTQDKFTLTDSDFLGDLLALLRESTPITPPSLKLSAQWLHILFPHDDLIEHLQDVLLIKYIGTSLYNALKNETTCAWDPTQNRLPKSPPLTWTSEYPESKVKAIFLALIKAAADIGRQINIKFSALNMSDNPGNYIGYPEFLAAVDRYIIGSTLEATWRINGTKTDETHFTGNRIHTSAVDTVVTLSVLTAGYPIDRSLPTHPSIQAIAVDFSQVICRMNGLISAAREQSTPNWSNNDLAILFEEQVRIKGSRKASYSESVTTLFQRINDNFDGVKKIFEAFEYDKHTSPYYGFLCYTAICLQWGMGSIPAQLSQARYAEGREAGYVPMDVSTSSKAELFWEFLKPKIQPCSTRPDGCIPRSMSAQLF